jgi:hypothetical protein
LPRGADHRKWLYSKLQHSAQKKRLHYCVHGGCRPLQECVKQNKARLALTLSLYKSKANYRPQISVIVRYINTLSRITLEFNAEIALVYCLGILPINILCNLLYYSSFLFLPTPYCSTVFSVFHFVLFLHRCNVLQYYSFHHSLLFSLIP